MDIKFTDLEVKIGNKTIIHNIAGHVKPGELLTIMGPSGAGKTTLLNVLSGRLNHSKGNLTIDNQDFNKQLKRKIAYVQQKDVFFPNLKLKQTLMYIAHLQMPVEMSDKLKEKRVEEILDKLELQKCKDTVIGDEVLSGFGLSGGERKRANIACKLISNPLILLIDEPTSGLDSNIAHSIMTIINRYARETSKTVVVSIHQPSSRIFQMFNQLLVLVEGSVAYSGKADQVVNYFSGLGMSCPVHFNPADFILDMVKQDEETVKQILDQGKLQQKNLFDNDVGSANVINAFNTSENAELVLSTNLKTNMDTIKPSFIFQTDEDIENCIDRNLKWPTPFWNQFSTVTRRLFRQASLRLLSKTKWLFFIVYILMSGLLWFQKEPTEENIPYLRGFFLFAIAESGFPLTVNGVFAFIRFRAVISNEREEGMYQLSAYFLSVLITETFVDCLYPLLFYMIAYWLVGLTANLWIYMASSLAFALGILISYAIGMLTGVIFSDIDMALGSALIILVCNFCASDFLVRNLPKSVSWLQYISFFKYANDVVFKLEILYGPPRLCNRINETLYLMCQTNATVGYIPGEKVLETMNINLPLWLDYVVLLGMILSVTTGIYLSLKLVTTRGTQGPSTRQPI